MKTLIPIATTTFLFFHISCTSEQTTADAKSHGVVCTPNSVCLLPQTKTASQVPPIAGSGPSFNPGSETHKGRIVKSAAKDKPYPKQLWANSLLFQELPLLDDSGDIAKDQKLDDNLTAVDRINGFLKIESWYNHKPADFKGKFVLIEFAASWCTACKRSLKHIEHFHETFSDELVVISIFETDAEKNDNFPKKGAGKYIQHTIGIDTRRRCANALGVYGIPHAILIEPEAGMVIWEGMVHQTGYELTDELLRKFFAVGLKK